MKDQRGKRVNNGTYVAALIAMGAQVVGKIIALQADALLFESNVSLPVYAEAPAGVSVLVNEGIEEHQKERWMIKPPKKLIVMDQRDNHLKVGMDICSLMPNTVQIAGQVTEMEEARIVAGRRGKEARHGSLTLKVYVMLPLKDGRAPCLLLPPEEEQDGERDSSGIILLN